MAARRTPESACVPRAFDPTRLARARLAAGLGAEARVACEAALGFFQEHTDGQGKGATLDTLGFVAYRTGDYAGARHHYERALSVFRELGYAYEEANTLVHIGETYKALAFPDQAREAWLHAHALFKAQNRPAEAAAVQDLI